MAAEMRFTWRDALQLLRDALALFGLVTAVLFAVTCLQRPADYAQRIELYDGETLAVDEQVRGKVTVVEDGFFAVDPATKQPAFRRWTKGRIVVKH
jgi:hypothetical protein